LGADSSAHRVFPYDFANLTALITRFVVDIRIACHIDHAKWASFLGLHPARFPKNRGMRIDFILGSPALAQRVTHAEIVREERKGKAPSDHAPVLVELASSPSH
jgi:exonuclease III